MSEVQGQQPAQAEEDESFFGSIFKNMKYYLLIILVVNAASSYFNKDTNIEVEPIAKAPVSRTDGSSSSKTFSFKPNFKNSTFVHIEKPESPWILVEDEDSTVRKVASVEQAIYENSIKDPLYYLPLYDNSELFDFKVFVNDLERFDVNSVTDKDSLFEIKGVTIDDFPSTQKNIHIELTDNLKNNGSLYLHALISKHDDELVGYKRLQLNNYFPKKKEVKLHKLIGGEDDETIDVEQIEKESEEPVPIASYWHPNVTIYLTNPPGAIDASKIPPAMVEVFPLDPTNKRDNETGLVTQYFPLIYQNKFWQLKDHMTEINSTLSTIELNLNIEPSAYWKVQALVIVVDGLQQQQDQMGSITDGSEFDAIKKILIETNPYLLGITVAVSLIHSLLEFLAFKNDISHWKNKKNNVGVSVRSIVANVIQQTITLLYLIDNSDGTSYMILFSQGFGILVEAWKITTIVKIEIKDEPDKLLPSIIITDKYELSETEIKTKEYDSIAFKYLYMVAAPLLLAYAIYSVLYKEYKSWYSFIITTLVGFVYTYGFLTLVPSVYINYRLKSVAHVPKKAMAYKVVNTFIDDLFAFVIKMPWLHRLATLRDDVIFFIYLYQTWIYRVDYSRVNEFGQGGDDVEEEQEEGEAKKAIEDDKKVKKTKESKKKK